MLEVLKIDLNDAGSDYEEIMLYSAVLKCTLDEKIHGEMMRRTNKAK